MAAYNGSKYIKQQIDSILCQLQKGDELIVVDDCSSDDTYELVKKIDWPGIKLLKNFRNMGHVKTFERAIEAAENPIIFLSDQDDIWFDNRVDPIIAQLEKHDSVLLLSRHLNFYNDPEKLKIVTEDFAQKSHKMQPLMALLKLLLGESHLPYFGCAMAFKNDLKKLLLPFPENIEAHDHWIAFCAVAYGSFLFVDYPTLQRRVHDKNLSPRKRRSLHKVLLTRINHLKHIYCALKRRKKLTKNAKAAY